MLYDFKLNCFLKVTKNMQLRNERLALQKVSNVTLRAL
jgi:hypothetical protein